MQVFVSSLPAYRLWHRSFTCSFARADSIAVMCAALRREPGQPVSSLQVPGSEQSVFRWNAALGTPRVHLWLLLPLPS